MARKFSQSFKIQAVEKALSRSDNSTLKEVAQSLSIGCSTLENWIVKARNQEFETHSTKEINGLSQDKSKPARKVSKPKALAAIGPNQIYTWDITYYVPGVQA